MSNKNLFMNSWFPRAPLNNGIGRFVGQLQRVTLKYCKNHGSSRGMRDFLEHDLLDYANKNPGVVVYVKPRRHRTAVISAEYLNGQKHNINCRNYTRDEVGKWLELMRTQAGNSPSLRLRKLWHTDHPSIQGPWTPFTFREPALNKITFPNKEIGAAVKHGKTATEQLLELFKEQQQQTDDSLNAKRAE